MRIRIAGEEQGSRRTYQYNLIDRTDMSTQTLSMARTTGYTCTAAVHLVINERFSRKGISPPEYLGEDEDNFKTIIAHLEARGVHYDVQEL